MVTRDEHTALLARPARRMDPRRSLTCPWTIFDQMVLDLARFPSGSEQIRLLLHTLLESLPADAVFWLSDSQAAPFQLRGCSLSHDWCRDLVAHATHENDRECPWLFIPDFAHVAELEPMPASVALVRLSRSQNSWLGAVRLEAGRGFDLGSVQMMSVGRRLLLYHRQQVQIQNRLEDVFFGIIGALIEALEERDPSRCGHSQRVATIALRLGQHQGLERNLLGDLFLAGLLHDLSQLPIQQEWLGRSSTYASRVRSPREVHSEFGDRILARVPGIDSVRLALRHLEERYDGSGFPDGLAGESIPPLARILAVADAWDSSGLARSGQIPLNRAQREALLEAGSGQRWDPRVVSTLLTHITEVEAVTAQRRDEVG